VARFRKKFIEYNKNRRSEKEGQVKNEMTELQRTINATSTSIHHESPSDASSDAEVDQTIVDLQSFTPISNYKPALTGDYTINIIDDKISLKVAEISVRKGS
jgi:hypothetical protein